MAKSPIIILSIFTLLLSACGKLPQTADGIRQFKGGGFKGEESFTVNRSYNAVVKSVKTQSGKCLNIKLRRHSQGYGASTTQVWEYHPKIIKNKNSMTLTLQRKVVGGNVVAVYETPPDGDFAFVLDITPVSKTKTQIDFYWIRNYVTDSEYNAVMAWVKQGSTACQTY